MHTKTLFPTVENNWPNENVRTEGALLLDHFAAQAIVGMLASPSDAFGVCSAVPNERRENKLARRAYDIAEAMIAEREKRLR